MVLVDTSAWIEFYKKDSADSDIGEQVQHLIREDRIVTTEPVLLELAAGVRSLKKLKELRDTFSLFHLAQIGDDIWHDATDNMFTLRRKGITIPAIDVLIGTAAITYDLYLIHSDKHYQSMAEILPLKEW
ncbi:MAG: PIN domain-containing protein [Actinomycetota bacterium]|nr:PIN domain-containing protein [Actinomycetota bacterium]MDD5667429.1 PIN domain-containing protein [Actinomycetota bacterium]